MTTEIKERVDKKVEFKDNRYQNLEKIDSILLREIFVKKKKLKYAFIGGMWYTNTPDFSLENTIQRISLPYPFSTYYTTKILDRSYQGKRFRSLIYCKMPLVVLQFEEHCVAIEFDPVIQLKNEEAIPFISLEETKDEYVISFRLFTDFYVKEKKHAWLGFGKKKKISLNLQSEDTFKFTVEKKTYKHWTEAVHAFLDKTAPSEEKSSEAETIFCRGKQALRRSYDHQNGCFLQLPWRNTPGFTFVKSSYSLLSYEAVRLHYFTRWHQMTGDPEFKEWSNRLRDLFVNPALYTNQLKHGNGLVWYNMTNLTRHGLQGYFYMDCGYAGYPGGQATIAFHLLQYLQYKKDPPLEDMVKQSLIYLLSTQNTDGSWPMALRQEGIIRLRPETLSRYTSHGGTAECARALLMGFKQFDQPTMKEAALNALSFLKTENPVCFHGLRDIGINEAEAFSAVNATDAFLDAYELFDDKEYLEQAKHYAFYLLTWIYQYETKEWGLRWGFHPISYSITPRLSPYESTWIVTTLFRLYSVTQNKLWKNMAHELYTAAVQWVTRNGGLSEGIFPNLSSGLERLPMEQTFATVELLQASTHFFSMEKQKSENKSSDSAGSVEIEKEGDEIAVIAKGEEILRFNVRHCKVTFIKGAELNNHGIGFSFFDAYSPCQRMKQRVHKQLRGKIGKFLLGISEAKYFIKGVYGPKQPEKTGLDLFESHSKKTCSVETHENIASGWSETDFHRIEFVITANKEGEGGVRVSFRPLRVIVLDHDVSCKQVLLPFVGAKLKSKNNKELYFDGFKLEGDFPQVVKGEKGIGVDQTLATNWTHGGIFKGGFDIVIETNNS